MVDTAVGGRKIIGTTSKGRTAEKKQEANENKGLQCLHKNILRGSGNQGEKE